MIKKNQVWSFAEQGQKPIGYRVDCVSPHAAWLRPVKTPNTLQGVLIDALVSDRRWSLIEEAP